ncbi:MAG TPA: TonB-dependent receptor [Allosphingosinicella sp.]|nr:TonB-dependent receptor [Allosphingosinicella sp.]
MKPSLLATAMLVVAPGAALAQDNQTGDAPRWTANNDVIVTGRPDSYAAPDAATATRTATPVEEVPQSIQTVTRAIIEEQDLRTLPDALVNVSGVVPTSTEQTVLQPTLIRGFGVNYYFDGMPSYQLPAGVADPATLVNVERIEVAKGPTATLYGGGSGAPLSGIINLVSRMPGDRFGFSGEARYGSFDTFGAEAGLNIPIAPGVGFRIDGSIQSADSFIDFLTSDRYALFPTLAVGLGSDTQFVVRGRYSRIEQTEYAGVPIELLEPARLIDRDVFAGARNAPRTTIESKAVTATLTHRFSSRLEAMVSLNRTITGFDEYSTFPYGQIGGTVYNFGSAFLPSNSHKSYGTAQLTARLGEGGFRHTLLVGVDYDRTNYFGAMYFDPVWGLVDYAAPLPAQSFTVPPFYFDQRDRLRTFAVFAQDQMRIGERLDVTVGLRWTRLRVHSATVGVTTDDVDHRVTPRVGATFRLVPGLSLFAGYSEGFQGVVAGGFYSIAPVPETSQSWEAGFKFTAPIRGLTGTAALYRLTRQNVLTADSAIPFAYIQAGEQRAQGVELDLIYEPNPAFSLLFNYAYTDAEISKDNVLPVGDQLRAVPRHSGRLAARYRFRDGPLHGLGLGAGISAVSRRELTMPNTISIGGRALVDAQASYDLGPVTLAVSATNLFGARSYEPYQYFGGAYVIPTQPRAFTLTLRGDF